MVQHLFLNGKRMEQHRRPPDDVKLFKGDLIGSEQNTATLTSEKEALERWHRQRRCHERDEDESSTNIFNDDGVTTEMPPARQQQIYPIQSEQWTNINLSVPFIWHITHSIKPEDLKIKQKTFDVLSYGKMNYVYSA